MIFRELRSDEYDLLKTFLYEAIFIPEGETPPERSIIELPELALYYEDFGKGAADYCIIADDDGLVAGAAWTRIMDDYGHVDDETPSLAMSVLKDHRGEGIGTHLLRELISLLREKGYRCQYRKRIMQCVCMIGPDSERFWKTTMNILWFVTC